MVSVFFITKGFLFMAKAKRKPSALIRVNESRHVVVTPIVRLSFPKLFTPVAYMENGREKGAKSFSCDLIADKECLKLAGVKDLKEFWKIAYNPTKGGTPTPSLKRAILNVKKDQWGENKEDWPEFTHENIKDGNDRTNKEGEILKGYEDTSFITARSGEKFPPQLILQDHSEATDEKDLYGGCLVRAQILCRPYDTGSNVGVSLVLQMVKKIKDGDRFGMGKVYMEREDIEDDEENDNEEQDNDDDED